MRLRGWGVLWVVVLVLLAGFANWFDRDTLFLEQARYCHNVAMGYWPDYDKRFAEDCEKDGRVKGDERDPFAEPN